MKAAMFLSNQLNELFNAHKAQKAVYTAWIFFSEPIQMIQITELNPPLKKMVELLLNLDFCIGLFS